METFSLERPNRESYYVEVLYKSVNQTLEGYAKTPVQLSFQSVKLNTTFRRYHKNGNVYFGIGLINGFRYKTSLALGSEFESGATVSLGLKSLKLKSFIEFRYDYILAFKLAGLGTNEAIGLVLCKQFY